MRHYLRLAALASLLLAACGEQSKPDTGTTSDASTGTGTTGTPTTGTGTTDSDSPTTGTTTGAVACDFVELTREAAEALGPAQDCGIVSFYDHTAEQWQTAHDCVLTAIATEQPFRLVTWNESLDSEVGDGYFGVAAESYAVGTIHHDTYPPVTAQQRSCAALVATPACVVEPGKVCLTCEGPGEPVELCGG